MAACATTYCSNDAASGRTICHTCRSRRYAREHPFRYHYNHLRNNAKRRGKSFELSFAHFKALWLAEPEKWADKKQWGYECPWQIDRIDPTQGYVDGNVQILEKRKNIIKYQRHGRFRIKARWQRMHGQLELGEEAPF